MVSGLLGGLPVTQVIVRSAANVQAGGRTRFAAFVHGGLHLLCATLNPGLLKEAAERGHYRLVLAEHMSFLHKAGVMRELRSVPDGSTVTIDGSRCVLADHDVREVIRGFVESASGRGIEVRLEDVDHIETLGSSRSAD